MTQDRIRLAVMVSGSGSNLQSIIDHIESGKLPAEIAVVISNVPEVMALKRAQRHNIPSVVISHRDFSTRETYEARLRDVIRSYEVDLIVLAGFMRVLTPFFIRSFPRRIINIHPALLPSFPGIHSQRQALDYGVRSTGCTVHFIDEGVDTGPIITQAVVPVYPDDTEQILSERILQEEHRILPQAIALYAAGRLIFVNDVLQLTGTNRCPVESMHNPPMEIPAAGV